MKKYLNIKTNYDPKITGKRDGDSAVRQKFKTKDEEKQFEDFFYDIYENRSKILLESFQTFDIPLALPITYVPKTKSVKQLDFMSYGRFQYGLHFLVSQRVIDILKNYQLPPVYHQLPVEISTFQEKYYLLGFPQPNIYQVDFTKTIFCQFLDLEFQFEKAEDYLSADFGEKVGWAKELYLNTPLGFDIINTIWGTFFSEDIIQTFEKEKITGYKIEKGILLAK